MINTRNFSYATLIAFALLLAGCATQVTEKPSPITRSSEPLNEFQKTILVKSELNEPYAGQGANIKAINKVDEILANEVPNFLQNVEVKSVEEMANFQPGAERTLVIRPVVKQVKFISGGARFFAGAFAGSSVLVMDFYFEDANSGTVLSNPGFSRTAGAYTDAFGVASNRMLNDVAQDAINYINTNR